MGYSSSTTEEGTGEIIIMRRAAMDRIAAEHRELADALTCARADLQVAQSEMAKMLDERDELKRRIEMAGSVLDPVRPGPRASE